MLKLSNPAAALGPVARRRADLLAVIGIRTIQDLLLHLPSRHEEYLASARIADATAGMTLAVVARVVRSANRRAFRRRLTITEVEIEDSSGRIGASWFNQPYLIKTLVPGRWFRFTGKVSESKYGLRIIGAQHEWLRDAAKADAVERADKAAMAAEDASQAADDSSEDDAAEAEPEQGLLPVYPSTTGLSQHALRAMMRLALPCAALLEDPLPEALRERYRLMPLRDAVLAAHFPPSSEAMASSRRRLAFDEMLRVQLALGRLRRLREKRPSPVILRDKAALRAFADALPFTITGDQLRAAGEALTDMETGHQMHRLLDGDVGSGKTVVAAIAMLSAARAGYQSALMAPTEILASQHYATLSRLYAATPGAADGSGTSRRLGARPDGARTATLKQLSVPLTVAIWTGAYKRITRGGKEIICSGKGEAAGLAEEIAAGAVDVVVGTHALVEETLRFGRLALAVVDEQHRFGVRMRALLCGKSGMPGVEPHLLSMTATPIPRTLALSVFGDLDLSLLREKPAGRRPVETQLIPKKERRTAYDKVRAEIGEGRQAFIVCPLIDPSDTLGALSVTEAYDQLRKKELKGVKIGMLHGKMPAAEKEKAMADFLARKTMALVATSVVEVGVDVPNATVMCIEGAERFGLAQLHQFRGRIGRGEHPSFCFLLPGELTTGGRERLRAVERIADGFALAEKDLEIRGPGDVLGSAQSGLPESAIMAFGDATLVAEVREAAKGILADDPELERHAALRATLKQAAEEAHLE